MGSSIAHLAKCSGIYGVGSALQKCIPLLLLPILTKYLSPEEFGALAMLAVLQMIAQPVFGLGVGASLGICYFAEQTLSERPKVVWSAVLLMSASAMVLLGIAWFFATGITSLVFLPPELSLPCSIALTTSACAIVALPLMLHVQFESRARLFVSLSILSSILTATLTIAGVVYAECGILAVLAAQLVGQILTLLVFLVRLCMQSRPFLSSKMIKSMLRHGLPLVPSFAFLFLLMNGNKYVLQFLQGDASVGIYSVGFNIGAAMALFVAAMSTAWYPFFMSFADKKSEAVVLFGRLTHYYILMGGTVTLLFFALAKPAIILLTEPSFQDAASVIGYVALAYFFIGLFNCFLPSVYFAQRVFMLTVIQGAAVILSLPFVLFLVHQGGLLGAAIALAASHGAMAGLLAVYSSRSPTIAFRVQCAAPHRTGFFFAIFFILIAVCTVVFGGANNAAHIFIGSAVFTAAAFVLCYMFLGDDEKAWLQRHVVKRVKLLHVSEK